MRSITFCVLITPAIVTYVVHYGSCVEYDDVSLPQKTKDRIAKMPSEVQQEVELLAKQLKYEENMKVTHFIEELPYVKFECAANEMKVLLEDVVPKFCPDMKKGFDYIEKLQKSVPFPADLLTVEKNFNKTENRFRIDERYRVFKKLKLYFYGMLAFLSKYNDEEYGDYLTPKSIQLAFDIRDAIFQHHEIDPNKAAKTAEDSLRDFSSSYARIRHGANGLYHLYLKTVKSPSDRVFKEENEQYVDVPAVLAKMHFLQSWDFTEADLVNINILHKILHPKDSPYYSVRYEISLPKWMGQETMSGILPQKDSDGCLKIRSRQTLAA